VPQTAGSREQRDQSLEAVDAWWVELLETGVLAGSDPLQPNKAVSNLYDRQVEIEATSPFGDRSQVRLVKQLGLYDQARATVPKLRQSSDNVLAAKLTKMGCDNSKKVLRRRGWTFPPLIECREAWLKQYPNWSWRDENITEWQAEESDDPVMAFRAGAIPGKTAAGPQPRF
jgi:hypothetical protein